MTQTTTEAPESGPVKLTRRTIEKGGLISFARQGVRASLYFNKTMFVGDSPLELVLTAEGLRVPFKPAPTPKPTKKVTPKTAKKVAPKTAKKSSKKAAKKSSNKAAKTRKRKSTK